MKVPVMTECLSCQTLAEWNLPAHKSFTKLAKLTIQTKEEFISWLYLLASNKQKGKGLGQTRIKRIRNTV